MSQTITAELQRTGVSTTGFRIPDDVVEALGGGRRPKVVGTVDGTSWRSSIASMGGEFWLGVSAANRDLLGIEGGQTYTLTLALDEQPREVEVPAELSSALTEAGLAEAFAAWSFTRRKEAARSVAEAKQSATRERRIAKIVAELGG